MCLVFAFKPHQTTCDRTLDAILFLGDPMAGISGSSATLHGQKFRLSDGKLHRFYRQNVASPSPSIFHRQLVKIFIFLPLPPPVAILGRMSSIGKVVCIDQLPEFGIVKKYAATLRLGHFEASATKTLRIVDCLIGLSAL
jgi:hypothetical protein